MRLAAVLAAPSRGASPSPAPAHCQDKVIVFSQWTSMLNLIEIALKRDRSVSPPGQLFVIFVLHDSSAYGPLLFSACLLSAALIIAVCC